MSTDRQTPEQAWTVLRDRVRTLELELARAQARERAEQEAWEADSEPECKFCSPQVAKRIGPHRSEDCPA